MQREHRVVALTVSSALFMQSIDSTVLGTALVTIAEEFGTDPVRMHMALTGYLLSLAVFMPLSGWLADRYGARNVFRVAVLVFTLASVACAFAPNIGALVAARMVQGAGGAMMTPVARLALLRAVPKSQLINATAWVSMPALVGPLLGPPLGGFIVTYASWPWIFWINVPMGVIAILLANRYIDDWRAPTRRRIDILGFVLIGLGVTGLVFGFETGGDGILPRWATVAAVVIGIASLAAYVRHSRRTAAPIVDLTLLKVPTFFAGAIGGAAFRIGIGALPFLLPLMLQAGFGFSPLLSGLTTFGAAAGAIMVKLFAEPVIRRFGFRRMLMCNAVLSAISIAACAFFSSSTPAWVMFAVLLVGGLFRSLEFTALNTIVYAELDETRMSQGTTFAALIQQLSLSFGIGFSAVLLDILRGIGIPPEEGGFSFGFAIVGAVMMSSALLFARLPADAGSEVANRPRRGN